MGEDDCFIVGIVALRVDFGGMLSRCYPRALTFPMSPEQIRELEWSHGRGVLRIPQRQERSLGRWLVQLVVCMRMSCSPESDSRAQKRVDFDKSIDRAPLALWDFGEIGACQVSLGRTRLGLLYKTIPRLFLFHISG